MPQELITAIQEQKSKITSGMFTSRTDEWSTPQSLFDELDAEFGFELDVCATSENTKCTQFFNREQNGLNQDWSHMNWMNPPYGKEIGKWVQKASFEAQRGRTTVAILPARTDTLWFHYYIYKKVREIRFLKGRVKFGDSKNSAPFPSMIVIF